MPLLGDRQWTPELRHRCRVEYWLIFYLNTVGGFPKIVENPFKLTDVRHHGSPSLKAILLYWMYDIRILKRRSTDVVDHVILC